VNLASAGGQHLFVYRLQSSDEIHLPGLGGAGTARDLWKVLDNQGIQVGITLVWGSFCRPCVVISAAEHDFFIRLFRFEDEWAGTNNFGDGRLRGIVQFKGLRGHQTSSYGGSRSKEIGIWPLERNLYLVVPYDLCRLIGS